MNIAIIGGGIFGVAAALELRSRGHEVTLFERGQIPNPEASSTDVSKVIRRTNYPNSTYIELATRSTAQWQDWHERLSQSIYYRTGQLIVVGDMPPEHTTLAGYEALVRLGRDVSKPTMKEVQKRFPQFTLHDHDTLFFDPWAGYLRSGQAVEDLAQLAREEGVVLREQTTVDAVEETAGQTRLLWGSESADFDRAVVATGPWVAQLLPQIEAHVRLTRQQMAFFIPKDKANFERGNFPVWAILSPGDLWYGFPFLHEGYVKIAEDSKVEDATVDVSREPTQMFLTQAREFVAERIPGLSEGELVGGRSCLYTNNANMEDEQFVIDWAPGHDRVLIACCGCGHGFKFGGAIGPVIADALEEKENPLGDLFRIGARFETGVA